MRGWIKYWRGIVMAGLLLALLCGMGRAGEKSAEPDYFPLAKGNYWIYEGESSWLQKNPKTGGNEVKSGKMKWKMEVVETVEWRNLFAALIKGFPSDLSWYRPGQKRGDYLIFRIGVGTYYLYRGDEALKNWERVRNRENPETGELLIDGPLVGGKIFGGDLVNQLTGRYCWVVDGEMDFNSEGIRGMPSLKNARMFSLSYTAAPEHRFFHFVPGLGITGYTYGHHGTTAETELSLVEFGTAKK